MADVRIIAPHEASACAGRGRTAVRRLRGRNADFAESNPPREIRTSQGLSSEELDLVTTLRRVTGRYHNLENAIRDGFVFLHNCETRGDEGPEGTVYVHPGRLGDGVVNPQLPDALIYEPQRHGPLELVGVELAVPIGSQNSEPPTFLGATFQREDEFGVFGLHVWAWRDNPNGLFTETNPRVSCSGLVE